MSIETLRTILTMVYPLVALAAVLVLIFYIGLIRKWWS